MFHGAWWVLVHSGKQMQYSKGFQPLQLLSGVNLCLFLIICFYAALVAIMDMKIRKEFIILSRNL
jgi:hypothetical protein